MDGRFEPATELELNRFRPLPFREILWNLSTQVNGNFIAAYITVNPRRVISLTIHPLSSECSGLYEYYW